MSSVLSKPTASILRALQNSFRCQFSASPNIALKDAYPVSQDLITCRYITYLGGNVFLDRNGSLNNRPTNHLYTKKPTISAKNMSSYSNRGVNEDDDLPVLSELPRRRWPNFIKNCRSMIFIHGIINPYYDNEFEKQDFMDGASKAVEVVSNALSHGDFETLETLLDKKCLDDIKRRLSFSSAPQRGKLKVKAKDIYNQFLYEIGIMFNDEEEPDVMKQRRWVEITYIAHVHPNVDEKLVEDALALKKGSIDKIEKAVNSDGGPVVINYRFLREFTKGLDLSTTNWTVSAINHFRLNSLTS